MTARIIFGVALFVAGIVFRLANQSFISLPLLVVVVLFVLANVPFLYLSRRGREQQASVAMVVFDTVLITAAVVFTGGVLSSVAIFYLWPIVSASLLLPPWAAYVTAGVSSGLYIAIWVLQVGAVGPFVNSSTIKPPVMPDNWSAQTVGIRVTAFLLIALLTGFIAQALTKTNAQLRDAKLRAEGQLDRMKAVNEQLRSIEETSQVFMRHHDVEGLMPDALNKLCGLMRIESGICVRAQRQHRRRPALGPPGARDARADRAAQGGRSRAASTRSACPTWRRSTTARSRPTCSSSSKKRAFATSSWCRSPPRTGASACCAS